MGELLSDYPKMRFSVDVSQILAVRPIWYWPKPARHSIVFFDSKAALPATSGGRHCAVTAGASYVDYAIDRTVALRQVGADAVSISRWDPAQLIAPAANN